MEEALFADAISEEEVTRRVVRNELKSEADRDPLYAYRQLQLDYIQKKGNLHTLEKQKFIEEWFSQMARVLKSADVVFTTCNNSGSDLFKAGFNSQIVMIDEAGQVNMSSMAIPLTVSPHLSATWYFGDYQQLHPKDFSSGYNEFSEAAQMSSIAFLEQKGWNVLRLNMQYRMCPEISFWPARHFYNNSFKDHPSVAMDNAYRKIFRQVTIDYHGLKERRGCELIGLNIILGRSIKQKTGTSLYNVANAMAAATFAIRLLNIHPKMEGEAIVVLTYYAGQLSIITSFLTENAPTEEIHDKVKKIRIFTVDKYQGEQAKYIILDTVVARPVPPKIRGQKRDYTGTYTEAREQAEDETGPMFIPDHHLSPHIKEPGRVCCALTRAEAGLVIICNAETCRSLLKKGVSKNHQALGLAIQNLQGRKLMYNDHVTVELGTSADEISGRKAENKNAQQKNEEQIMFMNKSVGVSKNSSRGPGRAGKAPEEKVNLVWDDTDEFPFLLPTAASAAKGKKEEYPTDQGESSSGREKVIAQNLAQARDREVAETLQRLEDERFAPSDQMETNLEGEEGQGAAKGDGSREDGEGEEEVEGEGKGKGKGRRP